jgi:hypothetical protein
MLRDKNIQNASEDKPRPVHFPLGNFSEHILFPKYSQKLGIFPKFSIFPMILGLKSDWIEIGLK